MCLLITTAAIVDEKSGTSTCHADRCLQNFQEHFFKSVGLFGQFDVWIRRSIPASISGKPTFRHHHPPTYYKSSVAICFSLQSNFGQVD